MKAVKFSVIAAVLLTLPLAAQAAESQNLVANGVEIESVAPTTRADAFRNWGGKRDGRWIGGARAPGGWGAYRRPFFGFFLPRYWLNSAFYIGNYWSYGFGRPAYGFGWSRYYDDAVLTDRYGRVYDYVPNVHWERYDGDGRRRFRDGRRRSSGLGGALAGGAVGAVAGGLIAGRRDNTEGAILGGVVGAVAGAAIERATDKPRIPEPDKTVGRPIEGPEGGDARIPYDYREGGGSHWQGTWTGSYNGGPTQTWTGSYDGGYNNVTVNGANPAGDPRQPGVTYPAPPNGPGGPGPYPGYGYGNGYGYGPYAYSGYAYGYGAPAVTTVTVQSQPVVTTTKTVVEETVYVRSARKRYAPRRVVHRRPRCACVYR